MADRSQEPLSVSEAKARFRAAAEKASPRSGFRRHPVALLGIAAAVGFLVANTSRRDLASVGRRALPLVVVTGWLRHALL